MVKSDAIRVSLRVNNYIIGDLYLIISISWFIRVILGSYRSYGVTVNYRLKSLIGYKR